MKKILSVILVLAVLGSIMVLGGCQRQSDKVSYNISLEADNFNISRRLTVINVRTNDTLFTMSGNFSIEKESDGDLAVIGENENGAYYKHFVNLNGGWVTYIVEDMGTTTVSKNHYTINFNPSMWIPVEVETID